MLFQHSSGKSIVQPQVPEVRKDHYNPQKARDQSSCILGSYDFSRGRSFIIFPEISFNTDEWAHRYSGLSGARASAIEHFDMLRVAATEGEPLRAFFGELITELPET